MVVSKENVNNCQLTLNQKPLEPVNTFCSLGPNVNELWDQSKETPNRIEITI